MILAWASPFKVFEFHRIKRYGVGRGQPPVAWCVISDVLTLSLLAANVLPVLVP